MSRVVTVAELRADDLFDFIGGSWHGPSKVVEKWLSRYGHGPIGSVIPAEPDLYCVTYSNAHLTNGPGRSYLSAETRVWLRQRAGKDIS